MSPLCDPTDPEPGCGPNAHCVPAVDAMPVCEGPVGGGTPHSPCVARPDCGAELECVAAGAAACCMSWCASNLDCGGAEACTPVFPSVFVGAVQYGVCWDGITC
ncbi:MAG: hypothetical protein WKG00_24175 [Polyangiaceae bacterium]